ncbi:MAG: hemolysin III family protein [Clostridia bacterium]|nr:hemolysin III family protein [Clostridia bacterium]
MNERKVIPIPKYTHGEEIFNMVTHIVGGGFGVVVTALCVIFAALHGNVMGVVSSAIYGGTMIVLYTMSSIYHGLRPSLTAKKVFRVIDHCSVYLLIAGTYTPIALCTVRNADPLTGWALFGAVWGMAALGITLTAVDLEKFKVFSMICYLGMGWCVIFSWKTATNALGPSGTAFVLLGGIAYTVGAVIYGLGKKLKYMHSVFHIFCVLGSLLQFFCIFFYVI